MTPSQAPVSDEDVRGDMITSPRSPWESRHNAICDELLTTRALLREAKPALDRAFAHAERTAAWRELEPHIRKLIEACP